MRGEPTHIPNPSEGDYAAAARDALRRRDPKLALEMVSAALTFDPTSPELLELLRSVLATAPPPQAKGAEAESAFFGLVAVRARVAADGGRLGAAVETLLEVAAFRPRIPYLSWLREWLDTSAELRGVSAEGVCAGVARLIQACDAERVRRDDAGLGAERARRGIVENLAGADLLCHRLADARPKARARLVVLESMISRRLGRPRDAKERIEALGEIATEPTLACELAQCLRALGETDGAIDALRLAIDRGASGAETWLDLGELLLDAGRFEEATAACAKARENAGTDTLRAQADSTATYASALADPDDPLHAERLRALAEASPVAARSLRALAAYRTDLPRLSDSLAEIVRHALTRASRDRPAGPVRVRLRIDGAPPGSACLALACGLAAMGLEGELVSDAAAPDRAAANRAASDRAESSGSDADLASVRARIAALAATSLDVDTWCSGDGAGLDVQRCAGALLGSPPFPARPGEPADAVDAVLRLAVSAMCLAARGAKLEPSATIDALATIAQGRDAWLGVAAITALGGLARTLTGPASRAAVDALAALAELGSEEDDPRPRAALAILSTLASAAAAERRAWFARLRALERDVDETDGSPLEP